MDNRLWFGLGQTSDTLHGEERDLCMQKLNNILDQMEEYMKPITPLFTYPETRYQRVISSEDSPGQASFLAPRDGQLSPAEADSRNS